ncbi:MAG: DUF3039 domain-containing protein [Gordonia sp. (in: high G+C Gram-positive bacteria)]|uniref:DUF3039 domain-containing protein n=1 Tax=Gordonia sp. (in: high G+C Gram-positive bacteria) TaxID=84139 RepID=UPI003C7129F3
MSTLIEQAVDIGHVGPVTLHYRKRADVAFSRRTGTPIPALCGLWAVSQPVNGRPTTICPQCWQRRQQGASL